MKPSETPEPQERPRRRAGRLPLLLEHRLDLGTGQVHVHQRVGERLDVGRLLVGQRRSGTPVPVPTMSARRPPGFMKAICAAPAVGDSVAHRCTSATRLPRVDSPPRFSVGAVGAACARLNGPAISPSGCGAERRRRRPPRRRRSPASSGRPGSSATSVPPFSVERCSGGCASSSSVPASTLEPQLVEVRAVLTGRDDRTLGDRTALGGPLRHRDRVVVGQVRVAGDDRVDVRVDAVDDVAEVRGRVVDRGRAVGRGRALVDEQHHDVGAVRP